ncbi:DUF6634 family protein [Rhizobium leguminosarum]|uniref:DUF6634 family protein n=2 Tax=Rhizobium leguminosarum TaxID=384 RepID=UPI003F97694B
MNNFLLFQPSDSHRPSLPEQLRRLADDLENIEQRLRRTVPSVTINDWVVMERSVPCLVGRTTGHPGIIDNRVACTTELFYLDEERGIARTMSRWYRLGTRVDPEYWEERLRENGPSEYSH